MKRLLYSVLALTMLVLTGCTKDNPGQPEGERSHKTSSDSFNGYTATLKNYDPSRNGDAIHVKASYEAPATDSEIAILLDEDTILFSPTLPLEEDHVLQGMSAGKHRVDFVFGEAYSTWFTFEVER